VNLNEYGTRNQRWDRKSAAKLQKLRLIAENVAECNRFFNLVL